MTEAPKLEESEAPKLEESETPEESEIFEEYAKLKESEKKIKKRIKELRTDILIHFKTTDTTKIVVKDYGFIMTEQTRHIWDGDVLEAYLGEKADDFKKKSTCEKITIKFLGGEKDD